MDESPARPKAGYCNMQSFWCGRCTIENRKTAVGWRMADDNRLAKLCGEVNVVIELAIKLGR